MDKKQRRDRETAPPQTMALRIGGDYRGRFLPHSISMGGSVRVTWLRVTSIRPRGTDRIAASAASTSSNGQPASPMSPDGEPIAPHWQR